MSSISKNDINTISKQLGEPSVFCDWRNELFDAVSGITPDLSYGLSISVDQKVFQDAVISDKGAEYSKEGDVDVLSWAEVVAHETLSDKVGSLLNQNTPRLAKDYFRGCFSSAFKDARVIYAKDAQQGTVKLSTLCSNDFSDLMCIIAENQAHITIIDDVEVADAMLARTVLIHTDADTKVNYIYSRKGTGSLHTTILSDTYSGGELNVVTLSRATDGVSKNHIESYLSGEGARVKTGHVSVATGGVSDIQDIAVHAASHTDSVLGAAGVALEKGLIVYRSDIVMKTEDTKALSGDQKARFLVMSKNAEVDAIPSLDIAQKDVSCSHSVSVSHLKDDDTFYPRLRGMDSEYASAMIVEGVLVEPVLHMKDNTHIFVYIEKALKDDISHYG